ncbi:putative 5'-3' exonuclease 20 [Cotonvirus japonicus]|uniref:5'-3' exonuclease 20 n=1 Tax=Cotonvirus japonicus TaxID=2811091 RepID=A0ABM7NT27_9VIRU|nr:putative 5'-3' exonuclease 20 [Cotonvirus japonicus]BCS83328.1 putative 5'-3' exonuclease 20 [Cotonvirus japonicus]
MGVLEFFGTLVRNEITSSSIIADFSNKMAINHLLLDFNSIIHVSSQKIISDVNNFMQEVLKNLYQERPINTTILNDLFVKYKMQKIQSKITKQTDVNDVIKMFHAHFDAKYMDRLIITLVINTLLSIIRTYCKNDNLETLMIAIDGVPSKGKMVEQKQRRYMGAITEEYEKMIMIDYEDYLQDLDNYVYLATSQNIKWSRNKITPGTAFMNKLVNYLNSDNIQSLLKTNRTNMEIIISDMYEVGEGEKKIVNYVNKYLTNTKDSIMIYSPDADLILLCMLLPVEHLYMLRYNQQTSPKNNRNTYDLINIKSLKNNISFYINNHPDYSQENFDVDNINYDIVCISTLFGNDFVPKIETINVKKGFQSIMDAYLQTLLEFKNRKTYLVKSTKNGYQLSLSFLKTVIENLLPEENDFIKHNHLYNQYITLGQIKNVFNYVEINSENIVSIYSDFMREYGNLKNTIKNNGNFSYYENDDRFMSSLKKSLNIIIDDQPVNTSYLNNKEMIKTLKNYYQKYRDFPRVNINLNMWSHSINDYRHKKIIKEKNYNDYQIEVYKFRTMLDEYYIKLNAQPIDLSATKIEKFYKDYFNITLLKKNGNLTSEANEIMHDYLEGLLWVFDYYFNDMTYINTWYYRHEKAPLLNHLSMFLENIDHKYFKELLSGLDQYHVKIKNFFNPVEQLIYVSPMTPDIIKLLPSNYRSYLTSENLDLFLRTYFVDIDEIVERLWDQKISSDVDCHSIPYFNKCLVKTIEKPTSNIDEQFIKAIRKVKPTETSKKRSKSVDPEF